MKHLSKVLLGLVTICWVVVGVVVFDAARKPETIEKVIEVRPEPPSVTLPNGTVINLPECGIVMAEDGPHVWSKSSECLDEIKANVESWGKSTKGPDGGTDPPEGN